LYWAGPEGIGFHHSQNKARKLMLKAKVQVGQHQKYKVTTNSNHQPTVLDNLLNIEFNISPSDIGLCG